MAFSEDEDEDDGAGETAISYTDQFLEAGVARLDALFGEGYAKANPQALGAYIAACSTNLNAFMTAAAFADSGFDEAIATFEEELQAAPPPRSRGGGKRR